ncbi:MAG TPA: hypothetical protein VGM56_17690, partial [Byssovorax sp.]
PITSANGTRNVIQTGGRNRLEMEDQDGQQRVTFSCPTSNSYLRFGSRNDGHEMIINTDGATELHAGQNWDVSVGSYLKEEVVGWVDEAYQGGYHNTTVNGTREDTVKGALTEKYNTGRATTVTGADTQTITGHLNQTCDSVERHAGAVLEDYTSLDQGISGTVTMSSGPITQTVTGGITQTATGDISVSGAGSAFFSFGSTHHKFDSHIMLTIGATSDTFIGGQNSNFVGVKMGITAALSLTMSMGVSLDIDASVKMKLAPCKIESVAARIKQGTLDLVNKATFLQNAGIIVAT